MLQRLREFTRKLRAGADAAIRTEQLLRRMYRAQLMAEIVKLSGLIRGLPGVEKLNVGALGNMVPQLHVHVIGRRKGDPAWPGPVWGHGPATDYRAQDRAVASAAARRNLGL